MSALADLVSPELVLVDPRLAMDARARLSEHDDRLAPLEERTPRNGAEPPLLAWSVDPAASAGAEVSAALRRITELSEVEPPKKPRRRFVSLLAVTAACGAVVVCAATLELGLYSWPL